MKRFIVTFMRVRAMVRGSLVMEPDYKVLGPDWPTKDASLNDAIGYLARVGFYNDVTKEWVLPGGIIAVKELQVRDMSKPRGSGEKLHS